MSTWHPAETKGNWGSHKRPEVGQVVAYDRRAWEVMHVNDAIATAEEEELLSGYVEPYRTRMMPYRISLRRVHGKPHERENEWQDIALRVPARSYETFPVYPHGRVPLCSCHNEPWPCLERDQHEAAEREMLKAERELKLLPGCCPTCQEPVTSRQRSIVFPGPYVYNPLAAPNPVFHLRRKCYGGARRYEDAWVAADPSAPRSLLTLKCAGTLIVHADGSGECFGADGSDCPSIYAQHRCMMACYFQTHGCPRECPPGRHGTRLASYPTDPRAVTRVAALPEESA